MDFAGLHELLRSSYEEMMPLASEMSGIAKGIAGLGALFLSLSGSGLPLRVPSLSMFSRSSVLLPQASVLKSRDRLLGFQ